MLRIKDLKVNYGHVEALKGIDFKIKEGQIISLIGANGAGKSTLLKSISGLLPIKEGEVEFIGESLLKRAPEDIVTSGLIHVPEGRRIFEGMSVYENLLLGAYTRKDKAQVEKDITLMFERFPILKERRNQDAHTLSGGEQQMLALSRALLSKPKILLLDEPSMGLAPLIVIQIFDIIKQINQEGVTILLVEQNAKAALEISDYAYILESGQIKLHGEKEELLNSDKIREIYLGG
ncbi:MAG TPA: ABC transporter ATP-binding protein [Erysipelothrix sp.]|nr:ABC transporter ATP-binding protein [Erysipelothrix sp.]